MKKILEISERPFLHGYYHTASFMSIVMNKVRFNQSDVDVSDLTWTYNDKLTKDFFCESDDNKIIKNQLPQNVKEKEGGFDIYLGHYGNVRNDSCYLFNTLSNLKSFEYKLNAMKESYRWSMAGAEIDDGDTSNPQNIFRAVFSPMNVIRIIGKKNGQDYIQEIDNCAGYKYMKLEISDKIIVKVSTNRKNWDSIYSDDNYFYTNSSRIGFFSWMGNDSFQDWFFSNFIQLHCSKDLECYYDVKLNYYIAPFFNNRYNMSNPWLEQYYIPRDFVDSSNGILDFVRFCLSRNKYVSLHLNEKYVPYKWAYNIEDFEHESMIYGIDDEREQFHLMGFNKNQIFEPYTISYNDFYLAYKNVICNKDLLMLSYKTPDLPFTLDAKRIVTFLNEYLLGINSTYREALIYDEISWVFGIGIYDVMIDNVTKLKDKKIPYLLSEHKTVMKERVEYLYKLNLLNKIDFEELFEMATNIEELSQVLLMMCIKFSRVLNEKYEERIIAHILKMKEADKDFIESFIERLERI